jgi:hypothetical protein
MDFDAVKSYIKHRISYIFTPLSHAFGLMKRDASYFTDFSNSG